MSVKQGIKVDSIVSELPKEFYIPDVESYFRGDMKLKRDLGLQFDSVGVKPVFITETTQAQ